jgi:hypothetical protein
MVARVKRNPPFAPSRCVCVIVLLNVRYTTVTGLLYARRQSLASYGLGCEANSGVLAALLERNSAAASALAAWGGLGESGATSQSARDHAWQSSGWASPYRFVRARASALNARRDQRLRPKKKSNARSSTFRINLNNQRSIQITASTFSSWMPAAARPSPGGGASIATP